MKSVAEYFTKKVVVSLSVIATVFSIVGGIWAFDSHYASDKRVDKIEISYAEEMDNMEKKVASALENTMHKFDVRYFQLLYDKINEDLKNTRKEIKRYPDDELLKDDYRDLIERRKDIKDKLDKALEKIKVK